MNTGTMQYIKEQLNAININIEKYNDQMAQLTKAKAKEEERRRMYQAELDLFDEATHNLKVNCSYGDTSGKSAGRKVVPTNLDDLEDEL